MPGDLSGVLERVARLELDLELTGKLLQARQWRAANGGQWPLALPEIGPSAACPRACRTRLR